MPDTLPLPSLPADTKRTSKGIAHAVGRLINSGQLPAGSKLPTVRAMAKQLEVSPTTVGDAWRILRSHGAIHTEGRRGTFVRVPRESAAPGRYWRVPVDPGVFEIDLSTGTPDPDLLPSLGPILRRVPPDLRVGSYLDAPVLPDLEQLLRVRWPFPAEEMTIVDGAQDGLDRLVRAVINLGDTVAISDPAFPPTLDMLQIAEANVIGVPHDREGIRIDALTEALSHDPAALFIQPRAHNPTGICMTERRAHAIADLLSDRDILVIENDHSGDVSSAPLVSLGAVLPGKVVHIRSFSKSHGPDLRLACMGGAGWPIDTVARQRRLGPSWSSRLLQHILLEMLQDPDVEESVVHAAHEYARRRQLLIDKLDERGIAVGGTAGLNLWIPVDNEQNALVALAAHGIGASPGTPFCVDPASKQHIRISIGTISEEFGDLADTIAQAAGARIRGTL